ncbi:MAG: hypothetical protein AXW14_16885 [Alteromonas sp. Nap_26]|nr:MAG: hypothetical protein AXW14_16885 [Alteromonas sp. Nap_26]
MMKKVSIVVSLYNEQDNIIKLVEEIESALSCYAGELSFELILVNDGSTDNTLIVSKDVKERVSWATVVVFNLFRNFGHEVAMTAGMDVATGDAVIFMDGDLQHPPALLPQFINHWLDGSELVLSRKNSEDTWLYRTLKSAYFWLLNKLSATGIPKNYPDFKLLDRKFVELVKQLDERERIFRGLLHYVGINNYKIIDFEVAERYAGNSKYSYKSSFGLAISSILQFSTKPLRLAIYTGLASAFLSLILAVVTLVQYLFYDYSRTGYATTILTIVFMGSVQLVVLGILGEYVGKIHIETKKRPLYFGAVVESEQNSDD